MNAITKLRIAPATATAPRWKNRIFAKDGKTYDGVMEFDSEAEARARHLQAMAEDSNAICCIDGPEIGDSIYVTGPQRCILKSDVCRVEQIRGRSVLF